MSTPKLDPEFVKTFAIAALQTLKVQCSLEARAGKPMTREEAGTLEFDIAGVIGLVSDRFRGTISIGFPEKTFLSVMGGMLGETFEKIDQDLEDGAGELMNIIYGCAKKALNDKGWAIDRAIPSIVSGGNMSVRHLSNSPAIILPFESAGGHFHIEVALD